MIDKSVAFKNYRCLCPSEGFMSDPLLSLLVTYLCDGVTVLTFFFRTLPYQKHQRSKINEEILHFPSFLSTENVLGKKEGNGISEPLNLKKNTGGPCPQTPLVWSTFRGLNMCIHVHCKNLTLRPCQYSTFTNKELTSQLLQSGYKNKHDVG